MRDKGAAFLSLWKNPGADTLILAGDITSAVRYDYLDIVFGMLSPLYKHIVYTIGNHECYKTSLVNAWIGVKAVNTKYANVHSLNNESITLDGVLFYGGSAWFPDPNNNPISRNAKKGMNDFWMIKGPENDFYKSNYEFTKNFDVDADVVVTHHLPIKECVSPKYVGQALNAFFVSEVWEYKAKPKYWLHGHTHEKTDFEYLGTRIIANPRGYPHPSGNPWWNYALVVEV